MIAQAGVAKMTLYRNFPSKDDLVLDFLDRREERWTEQWLIAEATARASEPGPRLLAVFDLLGEWFARPDYEGCPFLAALLEFRDQGHPAGWAAVGHLARIRAFLRDQAALAGAADPDAIARSWHILMNGAIIAAHEGDVQAAGRSREGRRTAAHPPRHRVLAGPRSPHRRPTAHTGRAQPASPPAPPARSPRRAHPARAARTPAHSPRRAHPARAARTQPAQRTQAAQPAHRRRSPRAP